MFVPTHQPAQPDKASSSRFDTKRTALHLATWNTCGGFGENGDLDVYTLNETGIDILGVQETKKAEKLTDNLEQLRKERETVANFSLHDPDQVRSFLQNVTAAIASGRVARGSTVDPSTSIFQ